jgi:acetyltransferase-like isoleucine patch superfamily enzyme
MSNSRIDQTETSEQGNLKIELNEESDYSVNFVTSSAINRINLKFLIIYIPILWFSCYMVIAVYFDLTLLIPWYINMFLIPVWLFMFYYIFMFGVACFSKLFLILINMIPYPREGTFLAEEGNPDFEFWRLRTELKKMAVWVMNNGPLPWTVMWAFRWFGVKMDFSSHLQDAWVDIENINFGRKITIGQGAVVMSSMIVGKYLILRRISFDDYSVIGGVSNISPGTKVGKDTVIGAFSSTILNQILEDSYIYFGIPAIKLKPNKYAEERKELIVRRDVDEEKKFIVPQEINIEEDKKHLINNNDNKEDI